jgi:NAD(P)-dependent dehydrogenase (short-subunit alcohol dehydrogenase family)
LQRFQRLDILVNNAGIVDKYVKTRRLLHCHVR